MLAQIPVARAAIVLALVFGLAFAQELPKVRPFLNSIYENEATTVLTGEVLETQLFPPRKQADQILSELPLLPLMIPELIEANFRLQLEADKKIAGRDTFKLSLEPKNKIAPRWTFWVDREWKHRLAFEETDFAGNVTAKAQFIGIKGAPAPREKRKGRRTQIKTELEKNVMAAFKGLSFPEGFRVFGAQLKDVNGQRRLELRASNGLSVIALVFAPNRTKAGPKLAVRDVNGAWVWVIANLPKANLEQVANSVNGPINLPELMQKLALPEPQAK
jgi:negative regulator of sigma E activity